MASESSTEVMPLTVDLEMSVDTFDGGCASGSVRWTERSDKAWKLKVVPLSGGIDPLTLDIGGVDGYGGLLYTYFNLHKMLCPTAKFLRSTDGSAPGKCARPGVLGFCIAAVWLLSIPLLVVGFWRWGDCTRNPDWASPVDSEAWCADFSPKVWDWCCIVGSLMTLPA
jgi:hypothetical protein